MYCYQKGKGGKRERRGKEKWKGGGGGKEGGEGWGGGGAPICSDSVPGASAEVMVAASASKAVLRLVDSPGGMHTIALWTPSKQEALEEQNS